MYGSSSMILQYHHLYDHYSEVNTISYCHLFMLLPTLEFKKGCHDSPCNLFSSITKDFRLQLIKIHSASCDSFSRARTENELKTTPRTEYQHLSPTATCHRNPPEDNNDQHLPPIGRKQSRTARIELRT